MSICSLKNQKQFDLTKKYGVVGHSKYFILIMSSNADLLDYLGGHITFMGLKVSRRFSKKAVIRNKIRRRIKHLIRILQDDQLVDLSNKAFTVIPKVKMINVEFPLLQDDLRHVILYLSRLLKKTPTKKWSL